MLLLFSVCGYQSLIIGPHKLADSFNERENKCYVFFCLLTPSHMPWWLIYGRIKTIYTHQYPNIIYRQKYHWPNKMNTNKIALSMFHQLAFASRWTESNSNTKPKSNWWWNDIGKNWKKKSKIKNLANRSMNMNMFFWLKIFRKNQLARLSFKTLGI